MQRIPDFLQPFTENLEDPETQVPAHISERESSDSEGSTKIVEKLKIKETPYLYSFSTRPKLRRIPEDQNYEVFMQKTPEGSIPRAENLVT